MLFSPTNLKAWIAENKHLFDPPVRTSRVIAHHAEFIVLMLAGPNARLDFHFELGEEFFYQIEGDIELHLKPGGARREVVKIREGEIFLCPANLAHSPRRGPGTWGLVVERKRKADEKESFIWFCERCDALVFSREIVQTDIAVQVRRIYEAFNANAVLRTCKACGYVFAEAPLAERLSFLQSR
jgi:3-hydroxyanthranilate 3,4-dioxygenase